MSSVRSFPHSEHVRIVLTAYPHSGQRHLRTRRSRRALLAIITTIHAGNANAATFASEPCQPSRQCGPPVCSTMGRGLHSMQCHGQPIRRTSTNPGITPVGTGSCQMTNREHPGAAVCCQRMLCARLACGKCKVVPVLSFLGRHTLGPPETPAFAVCRQSRHARRHDQCDDDNRNHTDDAKSNCKRVLQAPSKPIHSRADGRAYPCGDNEQCNQHKHGDRCPAVR